MTSERGCEGSPPLMTRGSEKKGLQWSTRARVFGIPLVSVAFGTDEKGKTCVAKGFVAVGQFGFGVITIAQFGVGILFGIGQVTIGLVAVGQLALGLLVGVGQFAGGTFAIGQLVAGVYGMGQLGWATYLWSESTKDMEAIAMFYTIKMRVMQEYVSLSLIAKWGIDACRDLLTSLRR